MYNIIGNIEWYCQVSISSFYINAFVILIFVMYSGCSLRLQFTKMPLRWYFREEVKWWELNWENRIIKWNNKLSRTSEESILQRRSYKRHIIVLADANPKTLPPSQNQNHHLFSSQNKNDDKEMKLFIYFSSCSIIN